MNQAEPLSASIMPYSLRACRITRTAGEKPEASKPARSRKRCPMGGYWAPVSDEAKCLAGQTYDLRVSGAVNRRA